MTVVSIRDFRKPTTGLLAFHCTSCTVFILLVLALWTPSVTPDDSTDLPQLPWNETGNATTTTTTTTFTTAAITSNITSRRSVQLDNRWKPIDPIRTEPSDPVESSASQSRNDSGQVGRTKRTLPCPNIKYRTYNGHCNNLLFQKWGQSFKPYARLLLPHYQDGKGSPRALSKDGSRLPCARCLSLELAQDVHREYPTFTHMLMQFGQFVNHDITNKPVWTEDGVSEIACCGAEAQANPECYPIDLPSNDPFYSRYRKQCMNFVRSKPYPGKDYHTAYREQYNENTAFIDGSGIYGSTEADARSLRAYIGGRLKVTHIDGHKDLLPTGANSCRTGNCFKAGDFRVNMFPSLTSMHTVFMREHNRIATNLHQINPLWDDERLYQESRKIVAAEIQQIAFNEFLPIVLGENFMKTSGILLQSNGYYDGYNFNLNPTITNVFTTAAFRFGHSLIQPIFKRYQTNHVEKPYSPWLGDEYFNSSCLWKTGELDELLVGLSNQHCQITDPFFTTEITNRLYEPGTLGEGQDLISINIQRGRDNGIRPYNDWREYCGLRRVGSFDELQEYMNEYSVKVFQQMYRSVDDIDLYVGGISEFPNPGGIVGPTFACIIGKQFYKLRAGDRFWFENAPLNGHVQFTLDQLAEIRKATLARIICDNTEYIETIQSRVMLIPAEWNPRQYCSDSSIAILNLQKWRDDYSEPYFIPNNHIKNDAPYYNYYKLHGVKNDLMHFLFGPLY